MKTSSKVPSKQASSKEESTSVKKWILSNKIYSFLKGKKSLQKEICKKGDKLKEFVEGVVGDSIFHDGDSRSAINVDAAINGGGEQAFSPVVEVFFFGFLQGPKLYLQKQIWRNFSLKIT